VTYSDAPASARPVRRSWLIATPTIGFILLALGWTAFWYYAANRAEATIAAWQVREAAAGRRYTCAQQEIGGYPFRIEVSCGAAVAEFENNETKLQLSAPRMTAIAQVYDPRLVVAEINSPLAISEPNHAPSFAASWTLGQLSLRGLPPAPESADVAADGLVIDRRYGGDATLFRASHVEAHGRLSSGSADANPVIDVALSLAQAYAPPIGPLATKPIDADILGVLRGLKDLRPKPWPEPLRQLQATGGSLEITRARIQQGDVIATAAGSLTLTQAGRVNGELALTIAGLETLLPALGLDRLLTQGAPGSTQDKVAHGLSALDRFMPGLGGAVRKQMQNPDTAVAALALIGRPTELEGRRAIAVPLRFTDGAVFLGAIPVGAVPPLY
jgi:hypothetical protein